MSFREERLSDHFTKFYMEGPLPFHTVMHLFTGPDTGDPHDHPWGFQTHILCGGYEEEIFTVLADGSWRSDIVSRPAGSSHYVEATTIHRIVRLFEPECWTMVIPGQTVRETLFWRFEDRTYNRAWYEDEWKETSC